MLLLAPVIFAMQQGRLDTIVDDARLHGAIVAVAVSDEQDHLLYTHQADVHVSPASNQKLFSAAFALSRLGPDYRPVTRFWKEPGAVVVDSPGDPLITHEALQDIAKKLGCDGTDTVRVRERYAPGIPDSWEIDDLPYRYAAPVAAFSVDRSAFELRAVGGEPKLEPKDFGVFCYRRTTTGAPEIRYDPIRRTLEVDGALPPKDERLELLSVPSADGAAAAYLGARMVAADSVPDRVPDAEIKGSNLGEILKACLPPSDNNIAENLLLMGATSDGKPSANPYSAARKMETQFLISEVGLDPGDIHVYDGSGLSRHDFVTARAIIKLLCWARSQPTGDLWVNCLAVPGKGTLGHRLAGISFAGKTGSSDMISALSGYLTSANGKRYCVSIVMNGFGCPASVARSVQDAIVEEVSRGAL